MFGNCAGETLIDSWGRRPSPISSPTSSIRARPAPLMYCHQPLNQFGKIGQKRLRKKQPITHCFSASKPIWPKKLLDICQNISVTTKLAQLPKPYDENICFIEMVKCVVFGVSSSLWSFPCVTAVRHGVLKGF